MRPLIWLSIFNLLLASWNFVVLERTLSFTVKYQEILALQQQTAELQIKILTLKSQVKACYKKVFDFPDNEILTASPE